MGNQPIIYLEEVEFTVLDFDTAERIFLKGLGLKLIYSGKSYMQFFLNNQTTIRCWTTKKFSESLFLGSTIHLLAPTELILSAAKKLRNGPDKVRLVEDNEYGKKIHRLCIFTAVLFTRINLSDQDYPLEAKAQ